MSRKKTPYSVSWSWISGPVFGFEVTEWEGDLAFVFHWFFFRIFFGRYDPEEEHGDEL